MRRFEFASPPRAAAEGGAARVLLIPGLNDSGPAHWQSWLQQQYPGSVRVEQDDWRNADLDRWARRIDQTLRAEPAGKWVAVAHSFGCLALARYLQLQRDGISGALFVAPADPRKFGVAYRLPMQPLGVPSTLIASETDPWMRLETAGAWALLWASRFLNLGAVGHINAEAGFGPLPIAKQTVDRLLGPAGLERRTHFIAAPDAFLRFAV